MPNSSIDTPQALDAAISAGQQARREKLLRRLRNQRIRGWISLGLSGCIAVCALAAYFLAGDRRATMTITMVALLVFAQAARNIRRR
jgi:hypothetical protein